MVKYIKFEKYESMYLLYIKGLNSKGSDDVYVGKCSFADISCGPELYIKGLCVESEYQQLGYGTILLYEVLKDMYEKEFTHVALEDASDRFGKRDNIYKLMGFNYCSDDGQMRGNIRNILYGKKTRRLSRTDNFEPKVSKRPKIYYWD
jgi:hypothetical protein